MYKRQAGLWLTIVALWGAAVWLDHPLGYAGLFVVMGPMLSLIHISEPTRPY